ncbi:MAG: hypothetical protein KKE20_07235, partial [Nanoarchaeota archaeon]|nr:hypothetical protein [Nanoarchaeota archaeon]
IKRHNFIPKNAVRDELFDYTTSGGYHGDYRMSGPGPKVGQPNPFRQVRGNFHEYTHLVNIAINKLPYDTNDQFALVEFFAKYFEATFTGIPYDKYYYYEGTGIKDFSDYKEWTRSKHAGKDTAFVLASVCWHIRETIGDEKTDNLVYRSMATIDYNTCASNALLKKMLESDDKLYNGANKQTIRRIFREHEIEVDSCGSLGPDDGIWSVLS